MRGAAGSTGKSGCAGTLETILRSAEEWGVLAVLPKFPQVKCSARAFDFYDATEAARLVATSAPAARAGIGCIWCGPILSGL